MNSFKVYLTYKTSDPSKCYIGTTYKEIGSGYKGSGVAIQRALKKYGNQLFNRIDLGAFDYAEEAQYWETFYIKLYKTETKYGGYNISPTGGLRYHGKHSDESKRKMSLNNRLKPRDPEKYRTTFYTGKSIKIEVSTCPVCKTQFINRENTYQKICCSQKCAVKKFNEEGKGHKQHYPNLNQIKGYMKEFPNAKLYDLAEMFNCTRVTINNRFREEDTTFMKWKKTNLN